MTTLVFLAALLAAATAQFSTQRTTPGGNNCPSGFVQGPNFSCYYFGRSSLNWFAADQYCTLRLTNDYRTRLVSIESATEQNWLDSYIRNDSDLRQTTSWWIGADGVDRKRGWVWSATTQRVSYSNWASSQPDGSGKCAVMDWSSSRNTHRWDDIDCENTRRYFICEL